MALISTQSKLWLGILLFWLISSNCVLGDADFGVPPFLEGPPDERIVFGDYSSSIGQKIKMDEEIADPIIICYVNYKEAKPPPVIGEFDDDKSNIYLGAVLKQENPGDNWAVVITKKQDYETEYMQKYRFAIVIGEKQEKIALNIENIIDNTPTILPDQTSCKVKEFTIGDTDCTYTVKDADGYIETILYGIKSEKEDRFQIAQLAKESNYERKIMLKVVKELDVDEGAFELLKLTAANSANMVGETDVVVSIENIPHRPPKWSTIYSTKTFDEKTSQEFVVVAIDGDIQLNKEINYKIELENEKEDFFHIGKKTGTITIDPIDRDALKKEIFKFTVIAYKKDNVALTCSQEIVIIINDVNDHVPEVTPQSQTISINEEEYMTLNFEKPITISDIDLGKNAEYTVELRDKKGKNKWFEAFTLVPNHGYQQVDLTISVLNAPQLDFEIPEFQKIVLEIVATEVETKSHVGVGELHINLLNLNDELPIFTESEPHVKHKESIPKGYQIITMEAHDRDIGDSLLYSIIGSAENSFAIDAKTGVITTTLDKSLDHEVQTEVVIQVEARDTFIDNITNKTHKTLAQLTIEVIDVNDKTPKLYVGLDNVNIMENSPAKTPVDVSITAFDPDSNALLEFVIEWNNTIATKQGRKVDEQYYKGCFDSETKYGESTGSATDIITVEEISKGITIDYEKFDMIYLGIKVIDRKQEINSDSDSAIVPIIINDVNDCPPVFDEDITNAYKVVKDLADKGTVIGSVFATDDDGPEFNYVTYSLKAQNKKHEGLVEVDPVRGELRVAKVFTCDSPNLWKTLEYEVSATDCYNSKNEKIEPCFTTPHLITIYIDDINNKYPEFTKMEKAVVIPEKSKNKVLVNEIESSDADRNVTFHTVSYDINTWEHTELVGLFAISPEGKLTVSKTEGHELDRDFGLAEYVVYVRLQDNQGGEGGSLSTTINFKLTLTDINDQTPYFDEPANFEFPAISEQTKSGQTLSKIHANDYDDKTTLNAKVEYGIEWARRSDYPDNDKDYQFLFEIIPDKDQENAVIAIKENLKDYFGDYTLNLTVHDLGPPEFNYNSQVFKLQITKYNYEAPVIEFPAKNEVFLLKQPKDVNANLIRYDGDGDYLDDFSANDHFDGRKWILSFSVEPEDTFVMKEHNNNKATLRLVNLPKVTEYKCKLTVQDNGTPSLSSTVSFTIHFIDENSVPTFEDNDAKTEFHENDLGLEETQFIPEAKDEKSELTGKPINYFIIKGGDTEHFELIPGKKPQIKVVKQLDYQVAWNHTVLIAATLQDKPEVSPSDKSILSLFVKVLGVNSHSPTFDQELYLKGISDISQVGKPIFKVSAHDVDVNDTLRYNLVSDSIETSDPSLDKFKDNGFSVKENTGEVILNFKVQKSMVGFISFQIEVLDAVEHRDTTKVNIYIIADYNIVLFKFENPVDYVEDYEIQIGEIFTEAFEADCAVDDIGKDVDENNVALDDRTAVKTHFVANSEPVDASIIKDKANDVEMYYKLKASFDNYGLVFTDVYRNIDDETKNMTQLLQTILIVVVAVLGVLCAVMIVAFIFRTRSLKKRLSALSETRFGSQNSNLNRVGVPAPNTNQHAIEGSNPVWGNNVNTDFETRSTGSGDSDLVGIEDNEEFADLEERRASFNPVMRDEIRRQSLNPMANIAQVDETKTT